MKDEPIDTTNCFALFDQGIDSLQQSLSGKELSTRLVKENRNERFQISSLVAENSSLVSRIGVLVAENCELAKQNADLRILQAQQQLRIDWLERQYFGQKAERWLAGEEGEASEGVLLDNSSTDSVSLAEPPPPTTTVKDYAEHNHDHEAQKTRQVTKRSKDKLLSRLSSDPSVRKIEIVENPAEIKGLIEGVHYKVIATKISHKIAVQPRMHTLLIIKRPVIKFLENAEGKQNKGSIIIAPIPGEVIAKSCFDVSFIAWLLVQKFAYHMPLYRLHDMAGRAGFHLARSTLARLVVSVSDLLKPIYHALLSSIIRSQVLSMDEVPCRVGLDPDRPGKMNTAYFWPIMGDQNEIAFPYANSREYEHVATILKGFCGHIITDGYGAYTRFVEQRNGLVIHAGCWFHWRREFLKAEPLHHDLATQFLVIIRQLAAVEREAKKEQLTLEQITELRQKKSTPLVDKIFALGRDILSKESLTPSDPLRKAIDYGLNRETQMRVFLGEPRVPMSTNDIERGLRPVPMGRKAWLFCWSEVGGIALGRILSLVATCQLHDVDPYTYFVDVLQRIATHKIIDVHLLTPRLWKEHFAQQPMRSPLDAYHQQGKT